MKVARTAALSRQVAPDFVVLFGLEVIQLRKLDAFAFRLFVELAAMCDFVTGRVETSYAVLVALLDHDRAPNGSKVPRSSLKRVRTALQSLVDLKLVLDLDRDDNKDRRGLFFRVPGRMRRPSSAPDRGRPSGRPRKPPKPAPARVPEDQGATQGQTQGQRVQQEKEPPREGGVSPSLARFSADLEPDERSISIDEVKAIGEAAKKRIAANRKARLDAAGKK